MGPWHGHAHAHGEAYGAPPPWQQPQHMQAGGLQPGLAPPPPPAEDASAPPPPPPPPPEPADTPMEDASPHIQDEPPAPGVEAEAAPGAAVEIGQGETALEQPGVGQLEPAVVPLGQQPQGQDPGPAKPAVTIGIPALEDVVTDDGGGTPSATSAGSLKPSPGGLFKCVRRPLLNQDRGCEAVPCQTCMEH